jgi:hypothetical protein
MSLGSAPPLLAPLGDHISRVVDGRSGEQVVPVDARRVVAGMTGELIGSQRSPQPQFQCDTRNDLRLPLNPDASVSAPVSVPSPDPARTEIWAMFGYRATLVDLGPESLLPSGQAPSVAQPGAELGATDRHLAGAPLEGALAGGANQIYPFAQPKIRASLRAIPAVPAIYSRLAGRERGRTVIARRFDRDCGTILSHRVSPSLGVEAPVATNDAGFHCVNSTRTNVLGAIDGA